MSSWTVLKLCPHLYIKPKAVQVSKGILWLQRLSGIAKKTPNVVHIWAREEILLQTETPWRTEMRAPHSSIFQPLPECILSLLSCGCLVCVPAPTNNYTSPPHIDTDCTLKSSPVTKYSKCHGLHLQTHTCRLLRFSLGFKINCGGVTLTRWNSTRKWKQTVHNVGRSPKWCKWWKWRELKK